MSGGQECRVVSCGLCCLDVVSLLRHFPDEDDDVRCLEQRWERGGNASNNCTVLAQLGAEAYFVGTLPKGPWLSFLEEDFCQSQVDVSHCPRVDGSCPSSVVLLSAKTGSRTIVHHNANFPELQPQHMHAVPVHQFDWIHFEGRNMDNLPQILSELRSRLDSLPAEQRRPKVSAELEKVRPELLELLGLVDVAFVGKELARFAGYLDAPGAAQGMKQRAAPGTSVVVAWGESGASACDPDGVVTSCASFPPAEVVDSLGAGDTFVSGCIFGLAQGLALPAAVELGCRLAGAKVGLKGLKGLAEACREAKAAMAMTQGHTRV